MSHQRRLVFPSSAGFTILELLVAIGVIAILVGLLLPTFARLRSAAHKTVCSSNLKNVGVAIEAYLQKNKYIYPSARHMPSPFFSSDADPPLPEALTPYVVRDWPDGGPDQKVYKCPGDPQVYDLAKTSYQYNTGLSGLKIEEFPPVRFFGVNPSQVWVMRDYDGAAFELEGGGTLTVGFFHSERNLLFADGHAGNF